MSVLSFPRIYFQGFMCWDVPTGNNNDQFPTYCYDKAELNWGYLKQFKIDKTNFQTTFRPWSWTDLPFQSNGKTKYSPPGEWNFFGTNACYFVQFVDPRQGIDRRSRITGGALKLNQPVQHDPLFDKPIELIGDLFGSSEAARPGRLVDTNPASSYSSQIYFNSMRFGDDSTGISGPCYRRMHSRFIRGLRNPNLPSAGHTSVTWQTCFPAQQGLVISNKGNSPLLLALQQLIDSGKAQGVMVRFNTYLNLYYQNGYFNGSPKKPENLGGTSAMYKEAFASGNQFVNPCYSRVLGVIGPWRNDELASVPEGRFFATTCSIPINNPIKTPVPAPGTAELRTSVIHGGPLPVDERAAQVAGANINIPTPDPLPVAQLGVTFVDVDYDQHVISIDTLNTFPEFYWQGDKIDLGDITLAVQGSAGAPVTIATLKYGDYNQGSYEKGAGILDIPFDPKHSKDIQNGTLIFQAKVQGATTIALLEQPWSAQTDDRGIYLNEGGSTSFEVSVRHRGQPAANAKLLIAKYAPVLTSNPLSYLNPPVNAIPAGGPQIVNVTNGVTRTVIVTDPCGGQAPITTNVTVVDVGANGIAKVEISAASAGLPVLMFYPFAADATPPQPHYDFDNTVVSANSYFTTIRVLPFDDPFVDQFIQLWNSTYDAARAWDFIYSNILYVYDMIYPVMLRFVPLGERERVEASVDQLLALIAPSYFAESTLAMPITRDLSQGKRTVLQLWGGLVKRNYPPQPISRTSLPTA